MVSSVPAMKAVGIRKLGGGEVLEDLQVPKPTPQPRDLLVKIKACGMNPVDWKLRASNLGMPFPEGATKILGYDGAGVITELGSECSRGFAVYLKLKLTRKLTPVLQHVLNKDDIHPQVEAGNEVECLEFRLETILFLF